MYMQKNTLIKQFLFNLCLTKHKTHFIVVRTNFFHAFKYIILAILLLVLTITYGCSNKEKDIFLCNNIHIACVSTQNLGVLEKTTEKLNEEYKIIDELITPVKANAVRNNDSLSKITFEIKNYNNNVDSNLELIEFDNCKNYSDVKGITCFRGNNYRDSASFGTADIKEEKLEIIWSIPIGSIGKWSGVGWNGQPVMVKWADNLKKIMNINDNKKNKQDLIEVIYATLDSRVYFIDAEDGSFTREPIKIPGPVKGSLTVDPRGVPLLYVGQGINSVNGHRVEMGYRIFSLIDQSKLFFLNGSDRFAYRGWPAFDSTALIEKDSDTMIIGGENGLFYRIKLNTNYIPNDSFIDISPEITKYRYKVTNKAYQGIENSVAIYRHYAYFADNSGNLQCLDINKMEPLWIRDISDDTDSTIVLEEDNENNSVVLYTACELDKRGVSGDAHIRKINALTGELLWQKDYECRASRGENPRNGGVFATPVIGKNKLDNIVVFSITRCGGFSAGKIVALDKSSGDEIWHIDMDHYGWSSPVDLYTADGKGYIIVSNSAGSMYLIDGENGRIADTISVGSNVEGSPAVFNNILVVGTRGCKIYGIKIQ